MEITQKPNVIIPQTIPEQLLYSTVRLEGLSETGGSQGTGFFFRMDLSEDSKYALIITNRHVVDNYQNIKLHLHLQGVDQQPTHESISVTLDNSFISDFWIPHPNSEIDLGAFLFSPIQQKVKQQTNKDIFYSVLDKQLIKSNEELKKDADVADEILMLGYPFGLWDVVHNFPVVRKGIAASHPALDFQGKNIGMVDIACFPGSSGSPILIYKPAIKVDNINLVADKCILLGILFALASFSSEGKIEFKEVPSQAALNISNVTYTQMIHLGYYVKAREILYLCNFIKEKLKGSS